MKKLNGTNKINIAVFISGKGSNLKNLIKHSYAYNSKFRISLIITDNSKALGLKFHEQPLATAKTPAYPSGHSAQGRLVARYLSSIYPEHERELMVIGDQVSKSRMIAKVHFASDSEFGLELGDALWKHYSTRQI